MWLLLLLLVSCSEPVTETSQETIRGRSTDTPVYALNVPSDWQRDDPDANANLMDTTVPLCAYTINDTEGVVRMTIYNFPVDTIKQKIPPSAQVNRWKEQLGNVDPVSLVIKPEAWGGFYGYRFEGENETTATLGWAMQIASEHHFALSSPAPEAARQLRKEMRADYTIKATGSPALIKKYHDAIADLAGSFELLPPIPSR